MKSYRMTKKERLAAEYDLSRDGEFWTQEEDDTLLEAFLAKEISVVLGEHGLLKLCKRSPDSIITRLWKLATKYRDVDYRPIKRTSRENEPWNKNEYYFLYMAMGDKGVRNKKFWMNYISTLLQRSSNCIEQLFQKIEKDRRVGFFIIEQTEGGRIKVIRDFLKSSFNEVETHLLS